MLGAPHHVAYVVADIEATVDRLVDGLGAGPFFLIERVPLEDVRSRDEAAEFVHNSAFGRLGDGVVELIEPISLSPERVADGFSAPWPRVHHLAYVAPAAEVGGLRDSLEERGMPRYLSSRLGEVDATMHDARNVLGHDLEIHVDCEQLRESFAMVSGAADGWDGSQPLRRLE